MYIDVRCRTCSHTFHLGYRDKDISLKKCPSCGKIINGRDEAILRDITNNIIHLKPELLDVDLGEINTNSYLPDTYPNQEEKYFHEDLKHLTDLFLQSNGEIRALIGSIIDRIYLLIDGESKNKEYLQYLSFQMRDLLSQRWKEKQEEFDRMVEEKNNE